MAVGLAPTYCTDLASSDPFKALAHFTDGETEAQKYSYAAPGQADSNRVKIEHQKAFLLPWTVFWSIRYFHSLQVNASMRKHYIVQIRTC